jgi:hypothetical protein
MRRARSKEEYVTCSPPLRLRAWSRDGENFTAVPGLRLCLDYGPVNPFGVQEKIGSLEERIDRLEREARASRESSELQIEDLNTQLHRERVERTTVEGALDSTRQDIARLPREMAMLQNRPVPAEKPGHLPPAPRLVSVA